MTTLTPTTAQQQVRSFAAAGDFKQAAHVWLLHLNEQWDDACEEWLTALDGSGACVAKTKAASEVAWAALIQFDVACRDSASLAVVQLIARDFQP